MFVPVQNNLSCGLNFNTLAKLRKEIHNVVKQTKGQVQLWTGAFGIVQPKMKNIYIFLIYFFCHHWFSPKLFQTWMGFLKEDIMKKDCNQTVREKYILQNVFLCV